MFKLPQSLLPCLISLSISFHVAASDDNFTKAYQSFDLAELQQNIKTLSSDEFGGRAPATPGGKKTTELLVREFKKLGFQPGNGKSYLQPVPLVSIVSHPKTGLRIGDIEFSYLKNYVANSRKTQKNIKLDNSELVFVGYGINAPEYQWNDYEGIDVKGKTVVVLVNDPGYATQDPNLFNGNTMTYYGRWIYKYEEAARQGAAAAIVIHETKPASYGWNVIESSWSGAQYHLPAKEVNEPAIDVEMWINLNKAKTLFSKAGHDFETLKNKAKQRDFKAIPLKLNASIELTNDIAVSTSNNVIATLPGSESPDEQVIYMAHWDHIGTVTTNGETKIYNGAHDNATGTAGLVALAKAFSQLKRKPKRSVTLIAVTAEEQGRLGSRYFANHPTIPLNQISGLINMDSLNITGLKKDVRVVGYGKSELEKILAKAASRQQRTLTPEPTPERGYYYRSDHFSLAKKGVPGLSAGGGTKPLNQKQAEISARISEIIKNCYHQDCDEYNEDWGWEGMVADLQMFFEVGYLLANSNQWPNWYEGTEFKAARDAMMKMKK
ncbi:M28 family metallopeptidase [Aliikangiella coralliicola]|uniref:M20/M25/M40 family metallo-hydrolase n=1 Tax=Aliikangiella coralliicola TaxID=2592383 RepID=A0A545UBP2_9GAMM|nr:M28 family metallopeptidase [Aliikangiella coralliicola]TQV86843.1 M20/M25/M40 family metallo-hydrolase [Aliikangiella coralliicola]